MTDPIRLLLADDQQMVRAGFRLVLDAQPDMSVVGEANDGAEALQLVDELARALLRDRARHVRRSVGLVAARAGVRLQRGSPPACERRTR